MEAFVYGAHWHLYATERHDYRAACIRCCRLGLGLLLGRGIPGLAPFLGSMEVGGISLPIALGLSWPDRLVDVETPVDWSRAMDWRFEPVDDDAFPAVRIAREVGAAGGTAPAAYNAANEIAVDAFHDGRVGFLDIVGTVERVVGDHARVAGRFDATSVEGVLSADAWARDRARELLGLGAHPGTGAMI